MAAYSQVFVQSSGSTGTAQALTESLRLGTASECSSCWENFNAKTRHPVVCPGCQTAVCWPCLQQTMATEALMPCCSRRECRRPFDEIFLLSVLPPKCRLPVRKHVRKVLVDEAKARLPEILARIEAFGSKFMLPTFQVDPDYERHFKTQKPLKDRVAVLVYVEKRLNGDNKARLMSPATRALFKQAYSELLDGRPGRLQETQELLRQAQWELQLWEQDFAKRSRLKYFDYKGQPITPAEANAIETRYRSQHSPSAVSPKLGLIFPCGWVEAGVSTSEVETLCRGMLGSDWRCVICKHKRCKDCHAHLEAKLPNALGTSSHTHLEGHKKNHTCKPEDVATARLIMQDSQACPKCGTRISRVHGCDHMWCTECKTSFNYRTGLPIADSHNTNPHYGEWRAQNRSSEGASSSTDAPGCDDSQPALVGFYQHFSLVRLLAYCFKAGLSTLQTNLLAGFRHLCDPGNNHEGIYSFTHQSKIDEILEKYALGLLNEKQFEENLFRDYRKRERAAHHQEIITTLRTAGRDILSVLATPAGRTSAGAAQVLQSALGLVRYIEQSLLNVNQGLGYSSRPRITPLLALAVKTAHYQQLRKTEQNLEALFKKGGLFQEKYHDFYCWYSILECFRSSDSEKPEKCLPELDYSGLVTPYLISE